MKKNIILLFILFILAGCNNTDKTNMPTSNIAPPAQFSCINDSDCADCANYKCVNYEWWKNEAPKTESLCKTWTCACINNKCANK